MPAAVQLAPSQYKDIVNALDAPALLHGRPPQAARNSMAASPERMTSRHALPVSVGVTLMKLLKTA